jgi:hypothetical protein
MEDNKNKGMGANNSSEKGAKAGTTGTTGTMGAGTTSTPAERGTISGNSGSKKGGSSR